MNLKSKFIALSAAVVLTLGLAGQCFAAVTAFTDLNNVPEKEKILSLQQNGYVKGIGNNLFSPETSITAAQSIQLIVNSLGQDLIKANFLTPPKATDYFTKADNNAWYANTLITAAVNKLDFPADIDLNKELTREEYTYYLITAIEHHYRLPMLNIIPAQIADEDQMTIDYSGAIQRAIIYSVVKLDAEGKFNPKAKITRVEAAIQVYNALEYVKAHQPPKIEATPAPEQ